GEPGTEPAARPLAACGLGERLGRFPDVFALVLHLLHVALRVTVPQEFPLALSRRARDGSVGTDRRAVDGEHRADLVPVEHLEHAPEADAVAVFVPGPVRDIG